MNSSDTPYKFDNLVALRKLILLRGWTMMLFGLLIGVLSILLPDIRIMSDVNSWLPLVALFLLLCGALEAFDAYLSKGSEEFLINLQLAILDTVVGIFMLFGMADDFTQFTMLVAAFMIIKGTFRVFAVSAVKMENSMKSTVVGGFISIGLGLMLWSQWPFSSAWFMSFCLCVEIGLRGWALSNFAVWLKTLEPKA